MTQLPKGPPPQQNSPTLEEPVEPSAWPWVCENSALMKKFYDSNLVSLFIDQVTTVWFSSVALWQLFRTPLDCFVNRYIYIYMHPFDFVDRLTSKYFGIRATTSGPFY